MLDAIYIKPIETQSESEKITFSIFEFKALPAQQIALYRHSLFCPVCLQPAYFRRASIDGKQACFGSRHHLPDCSELNSHLRNTVNKTDGLSEEYQLTDESQKLLEQKIKAEQQEIQKADNQNHQLIEKSVKEDQGFVIDFSAKTVTRKVANESSKTKNYRSSNNTPITLESKQLSNEIEKEQASSIKQSLAKLLTSLLRGSSLATSDVWVHTSEMHKWRAKNLFVKLEDAEVLDNFAPRMYWGSISYADKEMMWLNVEGAKNVAIPLKLFQQKLVDKYALESSSDLKGANIILFAKCLANKDKSRKFLQLWSNDLQYLHLVLKTN